MYRCAYCSKVSEPGQLLLRHQIYRDDGSIKAEVSVCEKCQLALKHGTPLKTYQKPKPIPTAEVVVNTPPTPALILYKPTFLGRPVNPCKKKS